MKLKTALLSASAIVAAGAIATAAFAASHSKSLTIAIVNNGHMENMKKVAEAYTKDTGVELKWVSLGRRRSSRAGNVRHRNWRWPVRHHQHRHAGSSDLG